MKTNWILFLLGWLFQPSTQTLLAKTGTTISHVVDDLKTHHDKQAVADGVDVVTNSAQLVSSAVPAASGIASQIATVAEASAPIVASLVPNNAPPAVPASEK